MELKGAIAVVTGGASGIGKATRDLLEAAGARPVTWDLAGADIRCDVSSEESVEAAIAATVAGYGVPSILVAAAGVGRTGRIVDLDLSDWDLTYAVNIRGVMLALRVVAREMIAAGLPGSCILISSVNGTVADAAHSMYSTSKAAVNHLARCAAVELGPEGIRVNAVAPGPVETPMMSGVLAIEGYRQQIADTTPLGRIGAPEDIAEAVLNLLRSDWVTGQVVAVDGAASLMSARGHDRARKLTQKHGDGA
ncbi:SDR family NAD(P)-dependent oxidoreductase [Longivirga aurantiaca]|uniref:SDR family NAD(P)-dependent oxidoreductase n=1 Tax=Longivirga aurantiaca TaxID=1837743 RepID=A0ABW1T3F2_9ACTN